MIILDSTGRDLVRRPPLRFRPLASRSLALALATVLLAAAPRALCACGEGAPLTAVARAADDLPGPAAAVEGPDGEGPAQAARPRAAARRQMLI